MTFDSAYALQGGTYPARIQRLANSAIAPSKTGVVAPSDLLVRALGASWQVAVDPGAGIIANVYAAAAFRQSYLVANTSADGDAAITVPQAGSQSPRTDYVVLRIYDTEFAGNDPTGKGCGLVLTSSLPTSYPNLPLAKITQPAGNTAGIQQSMVTDLRVVASPREATKMYPIPAVTQDTGMSLTRKVEPGEYFPNGEGNTLGPADIDVPEWAVRAQIVCMWTGVKYDAANVFGRFWVEYGPSTGTSTRERSTQRFSFNAPSSSNAQRDTWIAGDDVPIPASYRGTTQRFVPKAILDSSATGVEMDKSSGMIWQVRFLEQADPEVR